MKRRLGILLAALLLSSGAANAQVLTMGVSAPMTNADPHFYAATPNLTNARNVYDMLTVRDENLKLVPGLALSWEAVTDTIWEFKLRDGVKWHDGVPFTADDVAFTIGRVPNVPGSVSGYASQVRTITEVEVIDPLTVRLHTDGPNPNLPIDLSSVAIISRHIGETASPADYDSGPGSIGTGPYKFSKFVQGERTEYVRNDDWWGPKQPWEKVVYQVISNPGARVAAILSGDVDVIDAPPGNDVERLKQDPKLSVFSAVTQRWIYLSPDYSRPEGTPFVTDNDGKMITPNPLFDLKVRQALSYAINRDGLVERIMNGQAIPAGQFLAPGSYSYAPDIQVPAYDAEKAKQLLAEAGFPDGFHITLHTSNDRLPNDAQLAQAIAQMWTRIGVVTEVEALPWSSFSGRVNQQEFSMSLRGVGAVTGEAGTNLWRVFGTYDEALSRGPTNAGRYSNPEVDALTAEALQTIDSDKREAMFIEGTKMVMDDVAMIPVVMVIQNWVTKAGITYDPRMDEATLPTAVHPAAP